MSRRNVPIWAGALLLLAASCGGDDSGGAGATNNGPDASTPDATHLEGGAADGATADSGVEGGDGSSDGDAGVSGDGGTMSDGGAMDAAAEAEAESGPIAGAPHHWVTNQLSLPISSMQAKAVGFDIDGNGTVDNELGAFFTALASQNLDLTAASNDAVQAGDLVELHELRADSLTADSYAEWQHWTGDNVPSPDFGGSGAFTVAADAPAHDVVAGAVTAGHFEGDSGEMTVRIVLQAGAMPLTVHLLAAHLAADVAAAGCTNGRIGGAMTQSDITATFIPYLAANFQAEVDADPSSATSMQILTIFDTNQDGTITADEVGSNGIFANLLRPDLDLFDGMGAFNPNVDGVKDSLSVGIGFTCTGAVFSAPTP